MRCPDCNKFVGLEFQDPEDVNLDMNDEELTDDGELALLVSMSCRIVRNCSECGQELKEATIEANDEEILVESETLKDHVILIVKDGRNTYDWKDGHGDLALNEESVEPIEEGGGRYAKSFFGAKVGFSITCKCGGVLHEGDVEDKVAASAMDELV